MRRVVLVALVALVLAAAATSGWAFALVSQGQLRGRRSACEFMVKDARTENQALTKRITELGVELSRQKPVVDRLTKALTCSPQPPEIDYTSHATVSASLKAYVQNNWASVDRAEWETVWCGVSSAAIHRLTTSSGGMYVYLVCYDDAERGFKDGVFDVFERCWLDLGEGG